MPSPTAYTIYLLGFTAFLSGVSTLLSPDSALQNLDLPRGAIPSLYTSSSAAIVMGVFYTLAAYQENRAFFRLTFLTRGITVTLSWKLGGGWKALAIWEGAGMLITAMAMAWEARQGKRNVKRV